MRTTATDGRLPGRCDTRCASLLLAVASAIAAAFFSQSTQGAEAVASPAPATAITFEEHVRPLLKAACFHCHGGETKREAGLDLRLRRFMAAGGESGPAIVPGNRDESLLYARVSAGEMPPTDHKLTAEQIESIGRWIDAGAITKRDEPEQLAGGVGITPEDREHWAFRPVERPHVPAIEGALAAKHPIDAFLNESLAAAGITPTGPAEKLTLLLRAQFDLTGLPPTLDEAATFMNDTAPDAYERLLDRLLASTQYGERWGRHWLDVAGFAESDGYVDEDRPRPYAYKYRDYVIRSFNADKPFDQFIVEQLAGDELLTPPYANLTVDQQEKLIATGYLRMAADGTGTAAIDEDLARNQTMADTIKIVSTSLLGLTVGCAQCHDHRYDPILQTDYYRLRAVFEPAYDWKNWRSREARLISLYTDADRAKAAEVNEQINRLNTEKNKKQDEAISAALEKELEKFPAEQREALRTAFHTTADKRTPEQTKLLDDNPNLKINGGVLYQYNQAAADELKKFDAEIGTVAQQKPVEDFIQALTEAPGQAPPATFLFHRGDHHQPKDQLPPGDLTVCGAEDQPFTMAADAAELPTTGRRLAYARHLTDGRHPLFARVLVNRVWMHHFGRGIVATPSDFGRMGEKPSHPALLDWLAGELVEGGWRLKRLHKLIMTSDAYQRSSQANAALLERDPEARLLSRYPVRRLDAEAIRDRILATSGALNRQMFGPSTAMAQDGVGQVIAGEAKVPDAPANVAALVGNAESRRSVYLQVRRSQPLAMLRAFDAPVMETNCDRRSSSTVSPQSLMLMNSELILAEARRFAWRARLEAGPDVSAQLAHAWRLAYCRAPSDAERALAQEFVAKQTEEIKKTAGEGDHSLAILTNYCQALLGANEFLYVD